MATIAEYYAPVLKTKLNWDMIITKKWWTSIIDKRGLSLWIINSEVYIDLHKT